MNQIVIGMGEIGRAVYEVVRHHRDYETFMLDLKPEFKMPDKAEVMHICFPYSKAFVKQVHDYMDVFNPDHVAVYSTVPVGTTKKLSPFTVHSPVEGKHPDLELSIRQMVRWVGANDFSEGQFFQGFFETVGPRVRVVHNSDFTEFLKLRSTSKYGINLVWADYEHRVAESIEMPWELLKEFDHDYNKLYSNLGLPQFSRYLLDPPRGEIGGHCVVPNAKLLNEQHPSDLLGKIIEMEKK